MKNAFFHVEHGISTCILIAVLYIYAYGMVQ